MTTTKSRRASAGGALASTGDVNRSKAAPENAAPATKNTRGGPTQIRVFVYGTLLRGERNHRFIARSTFVSEAMTKPVFSLYDLGAFPALVPDGHHAIAGEVYEVDEITLAELDRLEGHPRVYQRTPIRLADNALVLAYLMPPVGVEGCSLIPSGSWRERHRARAR